MGTDYTKRGYLLPPGCKDLIDVLNLRRKKDSSVWNLAALFQHMKAKGPFAEFGSGLTIPNFAGEVVIPETISAEELAELLHKKPSRIIADLFQLGIFAAANQHIKFEAAAKLARKYGYAARREP